MGSTWQEFVWKKREERKYIVNLPLLKIFFRHSLVKTLSYPF